MSSVGYVLEVPMIWNGGKLQHRARLSDRWLLQQEKEGKEEKEQQGGSRRNKNKQVALFDFDGRTNLSALESLEGDHAALDILLPAFPAALWPVSDSLLRCSCWGRRQYFLQGFGASVRDLRVQSCVGRWVSCLRG